MITNAIIAQAQAILAQLAGGGGTIVVVPQSISVGTADNPAICLKKPIQVKWVKDQMGQQENRRHVAPDVDWDALIASVGLDTIVVQEAVFAGTQAYKSAVIWHENGHVLYGAAESGDVYLYEVVELTTHQNDLGVPAVRTVLQARTASYRAAVDPGKAALRVYLLNNWNINL
jgi:hypothetical protein